MQIAHRYLVLAFAGLPAALGTTSCYSYYPARDPALLVGGRASLALTDSGSVVLASKVGPGVIALDGTFAGDSGGNYLLYMAVARQRNGTETDWKGERVLVPRALVASLDQREFSASRSIFAAMLAAAGLIGITAALRGKGENTGTANGGGVPVPK
jgi:hypothetical protein